jgi:hypothetical protein
VVVTQLTSVVKCSEKRKQDSGVDDPLPKTGWNHVGEVFPLSIVELDRHHEQISNAHQ